MPQIALLSVAEQSIDESNGKGIAIELSLTGFYRGYDDKDRVQHPEADQNWNAYEHGAQNRRDRVINQHRDLEIERFFSVRVNLGRVATLHEPKR